MNVWCNAICYLFYSSFNFLCELFCVSVYVYEFFGGLKNVEEAADRALREASYFDQPGLEPAATGSDNDPALAEGVLFWLM